MHPRLLVGLEFELQRRQQEVLPMSPDAREHHPEVRVLQLICATITNRGRQDGVAQEYR